MKQVLVQMEKCIQDMQEIGSNNEFMVSRVFLNLEYPNDKKESITVDIKQTVGSDYENSALEVYFPKDKKLKINIDQLRDVIEKYYRTLVGSQARGIRIQGGTARMFNSTFIFPAKFEVDYIEENTVGW